MRFGQVVELLHRAAQAHAEPLAAADGHQRVGQLVARAELVRPRVHERGHAAHAVRLEDHQRHQRRQQQQDRQDDALDLRATQHQHAGGHAQQQHRGAEVRLHQQQADQQADHEHRLEHRLPGRVDLIAEAHQVARQPDDVEHLHRFHGLEARYAQVDPAPRAVHRAAHAGNEHHQQQAEAGQQQPLVVLFDVLQLGAHGPERQAHAHAEEQQVAGEVVERAGFQLDRAGGDHDHAQRRQRHGRAEQPRVVAASDRFQAGRLAGQVVHLSAPSTWPGRSARARRR